MSFIREYLSTILVGLALLVLVSSVVRTMLRSRARGESSHCASCAGCPGAASCASRPAQTNSGAD